MTDEGAGQITLRATASRQTGDIAVKNLRIIGSAVLLLNFREVGRMHLCSTGVTVWAGDATTSPTRHESVPRWGRRSGVHPLARTNHRGFDRAFHSFIGDYHGSS